LPEVGQRFLALDRQIDVGTNDVPTTRTDQGDRFWGAFGLKVRSVMKRTIAGMFSVLLVASSVVVAGPASAAPQGFSDDELEYGFFYGTFDQSPNVALFAGGTFEEFCVGDPGRAPLRVFPRGDGTVDLKVNAKDQEIHLYYTEFNDILDWLYAICPEIADGGDAPAPFASGTANLKVRDSYLFEDGPPTHLFNSVNGKAVAPDGTVYHVRGAADIPFANGMPVGTPPEWVSFSLRERR